MKHITTVVLCTLWLVAPAALAAQTATSASHDTADTKADPAPLPAGFKLTGFAEGSYAYSGRSVGDTAIVGRLYDRLQNRFMLNALAVVLDKPYDAARFSAGFHAELLVCPDATVIQSNGVYPDARTAIGIVGFWGPEEAGNNTANRYGVEGLLWRKLGKAAVWVQGDYGTEQANAALPDPTQDAKWWALGGWVTYDFTSSLGLALRADYVNDENGARSTFNGLVGYPANAGQRFGSGTATLNIRAWPSAVVRPEVRYDRSTLAAFAGKKDQVTLALGVAYLY